MKYQVEIKRVVSYSIFIEIDSPDAVGVGDKALEEVKTKPIAFSKTGGYIVESEVVENIKRLS